MSDRQAPVAPGRVLTLGRQAHELVDELVNGALQLHKLRDTPRYEFRAPSGSVVGGGRGSGHGDPVATYVAGALSAADSVPARRVYVEASATVETVVVLLTSAAAAVRSFLDPPDVLPVDDDGCTSHAAHGFLGVVTRTPGSDLCRWCGDFWRKYRQRPSLADLQAYEERKVYG